MSEPDLARQSNDGDGYIVITGDGDVSPTLGVEIEIDVTAVKVSGIDDKSGREEVNMDDLAEILNGTEIKVEQENKETEPEEEAEEIVVEEETIAEVKVGGVEVGISIEFPDEKANGVATSEEYDEVEDLVKVVEPEKDEDETIPEKAVKESYDIIEDLVKVVEPHADEDDTVEDAVEESYDIIEDLVNVVEPHKEDEVTEEEVEEVEESKEEQQDKQSEQQHNESKMGEVKQEEQQAEEEMQEEEEHKKEDKVVVEVASPSLELSGGVAIELTLGEKEEDGGQEDPSEQTEIPSENKPVNSFSPKRTSKLENTKFSKYAKSIDIMEDDSPKQQSPTQLSGTRRLDMSKFALFQKKSQDSPDGGEPKRNFNITPGKKTNRFNNLAEDETSDTITGCPSTDNKCLVCEKRVYPMEKVTADGKQYHKSCFRCTECKKVLSLGNFAMINTMLFCKPHFTQRFKLHGNYDTGFTQGTNLRNTTDFSSQSTKDRANDEIAATEAQTTESTPIIRDDIVKSSDQNENSEVWVKGGTKLIMEQFKSGNVSNVEIKRTIDSEPLNINSLDNYQPPPPEDGDDDKDHIKPQDMIDDDVTNESITSATGLKNLKTMFETGGVSNVQVGVEKETIEVRSLGDKEEENTSVSVSENVPQSRQADVVNESVQENDPGIKSGLAQKLKSQFEKGNVTNIEIKPKPDLERQPGCLEDYEEDTASQSYSESTPQHRDDVIRSDTPMEEQSHAAEGTRSLLNRWEKGEVEHAEEKPKEHLDQPQDFKDTIQFSESTPLVRDDTVKETDTVDESYEGTAKNLAKELEGDSAQFNISIDVAKSQEQEPSRLSPTEQDDAQVLVSVQVNGNESLQENGHEIEITTNGHYKDESDGSPTDPSADIKAARSTVSAEEHDVREDQTDNSLVDIS